MTLQQENAAPAQASKGPLRSAAVHRIEWVGEHSADFLCSGDRTSPCHIYPDCECESWSDEHDLEHPPVPHDDCWKLLWLEALDVADSYGGSEWPVPRRDGPIETEWDGDGLRWTYPIGVAR